MIGDFCACCESDSDKEYRSCPLFQFELSLSNRMQLHLGGTKYIAALSGTRIFLDEGIIWTIEVVDPTHCNILLHGNEIISSFHAEQLESTIFAQKNIVKIEDSTSLMTVLVNPKTRKIGVLP